METVDQMTERHEKAIADAGVMTEAQMREGEPPDFESSDELAKYIQSLVDRPHSYGTCVYAMSYAAVAAMDFVAHKLGVTGFQHSCADIDILRMTRDFKWGRILNFENLLYPQCCNEENFPSAESLLKEHWEELAKRAKEKLAEGGMVHPNVKRHWLQLANATGAPCGVLE